MNIPFESHIRLRFRQRPLIPSSSAIRLRSPSPNRRRSLGWAHFWSLDRCEENTDISKAMERERDRWMDGWIDRYYIYIYSYIHMLCAREIYIYVHMPYIQRIISVQLTSPERRPGQAKGAQAPITKLSVANRFGGAAPSPVRFGVSLGVTIDGDNIR